MKISKYNAKNQVAEIEYEGKTRMICAETAWKMRVDLNSDIPEEILPKLLAESEELLCRQYLYGYAEKYVKTKRGYLDKLREKGFSKVAAEKAVESAEKYGYINDSVFAQRYIEINSSKKGRFALKNELRKKGVPLEIIEPLLAEIGDQEEEILVLAQKLAKSPPNTPEERTKLARKLSSRGFSFDEINHAINILSDNDSDFY